MNDSVFGNRNDLGWPTIAGDCGCRNRNQIMLCHVGRFASQLKVTLSCLTQTARKRPPVGGPLARFDLRRKLNFTPIDSRLIVGLWISELDFGIGEEPQRPSVPSGRGSITLVVANEPQLVGLAGIGLAGIQGSERRAIAQFGPRA